MARSSRVSSRRIFMSYRRDDTPYPAGWLYDRLAERFGIGQVFKDVDSIEPGDDFVEVITTAVGSCDVLLALIGDQWLTVTDAAGRRRIDDPHDFVRLEIEAALARDIRVVPILVEGARMPRADDLPPGLAKLAYRQALELSPNRFNADLSRLLRVLDNTSQAPPKSQAPPRLELSASAVDFGRIQVGAKPKSRRVTVLRGGNLNARITSAPEWIRAQYSRNAFTLIPDPKVPGNLAGDVLIDSDGGPARILVTATADWPAATTAPHASRVPSGKGHYYQGYKLADWQERVGAFLIDGLPLAPGITVWTIGNQKHLSWLVAIGVLATLPLFVYNRWYRQDKTGQSWGKQVMGLRLVGMSDKKPVGGWKAAARDLAHALDCMILYTGFLLPILDSRRQTLADKVMKTIVISRNGVSGPG
jgi:uncharacterized RDD family membrane protein YckC